MAENAEELVPAARMVNAMLDELYDSLGDNGISRFNDMLEEALEKIKNYGK